MPPKKDNLPINVDVDLQNGGSITYANEVIAIIAGVAANEIDGIAGMCTSGGFGDIIGRNRNITRGVRVELGSEEASVDLYTIMEYGYPIQKVAADVQENVRKAIESMTGLHVVRVDVHVQGVSFEQEKKEQKAGLAAAHTAALESSASVEDKIAEEKSASEAKVEEKPAEAPAEAPCEAPDKAEAEAPAEIEAELPDTEIPLEEEAAPEAKAEEAPEAQAEEAPQAAQTPAEEDAPRAEAAQDAADDEAPKAQDTPDEAAPVSEAGRKRPRKRG